MHHRRPPRLAWVALGVSLLLAVSAPTAAAPAHPRVVSADPVDTTPHVQDGGGVSASAVYALARRGRTVYAGGSFAVVTSADQRSVFHRDHLFGFDAVTGAVTAFAPQPNGPVWALRPAGEWLYVGGDFTHVDGIPRTGLARIHAATGAVDRGFDARLDGAVTEIRLVRSRLLVGGDFTGALGALHPATGARTGYLRAPIRGSVPGTGRPSVLRFAVDPAGTRLVGIGNFTTVAGRSRPRAFMLNLGAARAELAPWHYAPLRNRCRSLRTPAYLRDVAFSPDGSYFVLVSTGWVPLPGGLGRDICDAAARFDTAVPRPRRPVWINYSGGDTLLSVAASGAAVYVQGHFRWLDNPHGRGFAGPGAVPRSGIGALHPTTGNALPWNPGKSRAVGGRDFMVTPAGLWVGSDGPMFGGEYHDNIAFCPLSPAMRTASAHPTAG